MLTPPSDPRADRRAFDMAVVDAIRELQQPTQPHPAFACAAADVPPAANWPNGVVRVTNLDILAVSNGVAWIRQDTGAPI